MARQPTDPEGTNLIAGNLKAANFSDVEKVKAASNFLRGTIAAGLQNEITGALSDDDAKLLKFHGSYQQDQRDLRLERQRQKLEPAYQFMIRVRAPGGVLQPAQWLELDALAQQYGNGSLRLTTRQAVQLHGVLKWNLPATLQRINDRLLTTLATCGDVNRNVMCSPLPELSHLHGEVLQWAQRINDHLLPKTKAYHEIWLAGEKVADSKDEEPLYGPNYMPRKFKIAVALPPANDVDVFAHDLGFIAIAAAGALAGFNVVVGGGMGMTYGEPETYPELGRVIGFCPAEEVVNVAEKVVTIQRDYGNRADRKLARLKYTINHRGLDWFKEELHQRLGWQLAPAKSFEFHSNGDQFGWTEAGDGLHYLTLFVPNGRVRDQEGYPLLTGLRAIAARHQGDLRITPNQNLIIGGVPSEEKETIAKLVAEYRLDSGPSSSPRHRNALACVAFPTCGLAMAEAERYLPSLIDKLDGMLADMGLAEEEIVIRMSGCPNGCSRPYLGEIAFTGKGPGKYNLYLGGSLVGHRLNKLYRENIGEEEILAELSPLFEHWARERREGEPFGDFVLRAGYISAVTSGLNFH